MSEVEFIAAHGITICHEPSPSGGHGWQIVGGGALAARIGVPVICDFRAADLALGGQGAPLAPLADLPLRGSDQEDRVILNLGGIANLSALPRGADSMHQVRSCDVGPANMPLDELCRRDATLELSYDDGGSLAESSSPNESLLEDLLNEDWVRSRLPRSFGREQFGSDWVDAVEARAPSLGLAERLATLVDFEARVTRIVVEELLGDWRVDAGQPLRLLVTGGGRHNRAVMAALRRHFPDAKVEPIEAIGENGDAKECVDFAWLGWMRWNSQVAELKCMSGAVADTVLGCIYDGRRAQG